MTLASRAGATETISTGGEVTLSTRVAGTSASGSFQLSFRGDGLAGTFSASFCPGGVEP